MLLLEFFRISEPHPILTCLGCSLRFDFAIPKIFQNIIYIFGFYNIWNKDIIKKQNPKHYQNSKFYFITGQRDSSNPSNINGKRHLTNANKKTIIRIYPNLSHQYPNDLYTGIHNFLEMK